MFESLEISSAKSFKDASGYFFLYFTASNTLSSNKDNVSVSSNNLISSNSLYLIEFALVFIKSLILVSAIYYILSYSLCQTSFGLKVMSYKLKSIDGRKPKLGQIIIRVLW